MSSMHFYGWKKGLKTGQYYLRSRPARDAIKFTVDVGQLLEASDAGNNEMLLSVLTAQKKEKEAAVISPDKKKEEGKTEEKVEE
jgi:hypothetical protein